MFGFFFKNESLAADWPVNTYWNDLSDKRGCLIRLRHFSPLCSQPGSCKCQPSPQNLHIRVSCSSFQFYISGFLLISSCSRSTLNFHSYRRITLFPSVPISWQNFLGILKSISFLENVGMEFPHGHTRFDRRNRSVKQRRIL